MRVSRQELIHCRLQAMLREHTFNGNTLKYLGVRKDSIGVPQHWDSIDGHEVPVDAIEELESVDDDT